MSKEELNQVVTSVAILARANCERRTWPFYEHVAPADATEYEKKSGGQVEQPKIYTNLRHRQRDMSDPYSQPKRKVEQGRQSCNDRFGLASTALLIPAAALAKTCA